MGLFLLSFRQNYFQVKLSILMIYTQVLLTFLIKGCLSSEYW